MSKIIISLLAVLFFMLPAQAQEQKQEQKPAPLTAVPVDVKPAVPENLIQMLIRYNTLDLSDNQILDDVGMTVYCPMYARFFNNEFQWQKFREAMRESFRLNRDKLPTRFSYIAKVKLDRYNDARKAFDFPNKSILGFNELELYYEHDMECAGKQTTRLPVRYVASLRPPFKMPNLPVPPEKAKVVVEHMLQAGNLDRQVYLSFTVDIADVLAFRDDPERSEITAVLDARISRLDVFEDDKGQNLIETYGYAQAKSVGDTINKLPVKPGSTSLPTTPEPPPRPTLPNPSEKKDKPVAK